MTSSVLLVSTAWALVSALAIALLGAVTVRAGPLGGADLGRFALVWGASVVLANLTAFGPSAGAAVLLGSAVVAVQVPLPYLLLRFASTQAHGGPWERRLRMLRTGAATEAVLVGGLLLAAPHLLVAGSAARGSAFVPLWGPLYGSLVTAPFVAAQAVALLALQWALDGSATRLTTRSRATLVAGLGLYGGYLAGNAIPFYLDPLVLGPELALPLVASIVLAGACVAVAVRELQRARREGRGPGRLHRLLALAVLLPLGEGFVETLLDRTVLPTLYTAGFWRLASVAVLSLGIARWRLLDLPPWAQRVSAAGPGVVTALALGVTSYTAVAFVDPTGGLSLIVGAVLGGAAIVPGIRASERLVDVPPAGPGRAEALFAQRVDAYRSAVEVSLARGDATGDAAFLETLRRRFQLSPEAARVIRHVAEASVLVPTEGGEVRFERLRLLGEGGAGRTWLARDRVRERLVVLKEPLPPWQRDPDLRDRVLSEARLAARVHHPNVVRVEEVVEGPAPLLVLEHLEGGSLADLLRGRRNLPAAEAVPVVVDVLRGLQAVHEAGIVHRDVSPGNVLLDAEGRAKVSDFGIAVRDAGHRTVLEGAGAAGTPAFRSPEAAAGASPDPRGDVYGAAAVLVACLTGTPPDPQDPLASLSGVPEALHTALAGALAPDPEQRTATAAALATELEAVEVGA